MICCCIAGDAGTADTQSLSRMTAVIFVPLTLIFAVAAITLLALVLYYWKRLRRMPKNTPGTVRVCKHVDIGDWITCWETDAVHGSARLGLCWLCDTVGNGSLSSPQNNRSVGLAYSNMKIVKKTKLICLQKCLLENYENDDDFLIDL